ncbi:MAG: hypothetical protein QM763_21120 [Agriterribacter sp.]
MFWLIKKNHRRFEVSIWKSLKIMTTPQAIEIQDIASIRLQTALPYAFTEQGVAMLSSILNSIALLK